MRIELEKASKRYRFDWIFSDLTFSFHQGKYYAVAGPNGSGKSTLLKVLSGQLTPSRGNIRYSNNEQTITRESVYQHISIAAPYVELIEEFSLGEMIDFHRQFKPFQNKRSTNELLKILELPKVKNREIRFFSSGMKQRVKLLLAILSQTTILLLDEPTTNLDQQGIQWYEHIMEQFAQNKIVIIASNVDRDFIRKDGIVNIMDYKKDRRKLEREKGGL